MGQVAHVVGIEVDVDGAEDHQQQPEPAVARTRTTDPTTPRATKTTFEATTRCSTTLGIATHAA